MFAQFKLYIIGGATIVALAFVSYLLWQLSALSGQLSASESQRIAATGERDRAVEANKANTAALQTLAANQALNNAILTGLSANLDKVRADISKVGSDRNNLAKANPDVKAFLDTPVPAAMRLRKSGN